MAKIKTIDGRGLGYEEMMDLYEKYKACETFGERLELWDEYGLDEFLVDITDEDDFIISTIRLDGLEPLPLEDNIRRYEYLKKRALQKNRVRKVTTYDEMVATYWERMNLSPNPKIVLESFQKKEKERMEFEKKYEDYFSAIKEKFEETRILAKRWGYNFANEGLAKNTDAIYSGFEDHITHWNLANDVVKGSLAFEGELVLQFEQGIELAKFHGFLEEQKERLQRGDDIQYPEPEMEEEKQVREYIEKEKGRLKMKWGKSKEALYQLMADLLGNYIQPDNTTLLAEWIQENFEDMPQPSTIRPRIAKLRRNNDERPRGSYDAKKIEKLE